MMQQALTDYNDLNVRHGIEVVRKQVLAQIAALPDKPPIMPLYDQAQRHQRTNTMNQTHKNAMGYSQAQPAIKTIRAAANDAETGQHALYTQNDQHRKALTVAQKTQMSWDVINEKEPIKLLINDKGQPNPYPIEALPPLAKEAVEAIAYYAQAPIAMAGQCVLGALSYLAQEHVNAFDRYSAQGKPCSLYIITEGASGDRKSTCQRLADQRIYENERQCIERYKRNAQYYRDELAKLKGKEREYYLNHEPEPKDPQRLFTDATLEPIISRFIQGEMTDAAWTSDEAGQIFGGHTLKGETRDAALGALTSLWDSGKAQRTRSKSNQNISGSAYDVRLTINTLGQRVVLETVLSDPVMREQGFLPRFLFSAPESLAGTRIHTQDTWTAKPYTDARLLRYWQRCYDLIHLPAPKDDEGNSARAVIPIDQDAMPLLLELYNRTEREQSKVGKYAHLRPFAARAAELTTRVATVLAFFEGLATINTHIMQSAITLVQYSIDEWERYDDVVEHDKALLDADKLENWLIRHCDQNTLMVARSHMQQYVTPTHLRPKKALDAALKTLTACNHARQVQHGRKKFIELNPVLVKLKLPKLDKANTS